MAKVGGARAGAGRKPGKVSQAKRDLQAMAKEHAADALQVLVDIAKSSSAAEGARVSAATAILDRGYGKPAQSLALSNPDGSSLMPQVIQIVGVQANHDQGGGRAS